MILLDANLLVYAYVADMPDHKAALDWLEGKLNGTAPVGLPWSSLLAFLRIVTNSRLFAKPSSLADSWQQVGRWTSAQSVFIPGPTDKHPEVLERYLKCCTGGNHVPDAHLAALATERGLELQTADRGFARFSGLRWSNPLET